MTEAIAREVLKVANGARIVFDPMSHLRTASVGVWLGAGARHEPADRNGLAHFLEHMAFKAAAGRNALELAEAVEAKGALMNASTDYERTSYYVRCLGGDAPEMLDVALSLVFAPEHPKAEIAREKNVVLQEIGEAAGQADDLVMELAQAASYPGHPLGRPILGAPKTLRKITREDLFAFARSNYAPARTVVSVAGAFDRTAVEMVARKWLEPLMHTPAPVSIAPARPAASVRTAERDLEQCHLVLSRMAPSATSDDRFAARIFAEILGGGMASRLFQEVREARGLAYTIDASCDQYSDAGRLSVYAGCAPGDAAEVVRITSDIWTDLAAKGPTPAELDRAKAVMKAQFAMASEGPAARAGTAAYELLMFDRLIDIEEVLERVDAVTLPDVRRMAEQAVSGPAIAAAVGPAAGLGAAEKFVA
ncbi:MAG: pitrilysin family protein [Alphaproteobacteria bacterium]|nr:pitrilysin family protein [Alphaproteobacteria bacterium]